MEIIKPTQIKRLLIDSGAIIGFLIALYFIYLQIFIIKAFCKFCLIIDFGMIIAFILIVAKEIQIKNNELKINPTRRRSKDFLRCFKNLIIKNRISKSYRHPNLDAQIRKKKNKIRNKTFRKSI